MKLEEEQTLLFLNEVNSQIHKLIDRIIENIPEVADKNFINSIICDGYSLVGDVAADRKLALDSTHLETVYYWFEMLRGKFSQHSFETWQKWALEDKYDFIADAILEDRCSYSHSYAYVVRRYEIDSPSERLLNIFLSELYSHLYSFPD